MRRKWRQERYTVAGPVTCAATMLGCLLLVAAFLRHTNPKVEPVKACQSATCQLYAQAVNFSLLSAVEPCRDYYQHVCGGWLRRRGDTVRERILAAFYDRVTLLARRLVVPPEFQSPRQRAAMAYTSCADIVFRGYKEEREIEGALRGAGLLWPREAPASNPLSTLLYLCQHWGTAFLIDMHLVGRQHYVVKPTSMYAELLLLRDHAQRHTELFDALRDRYGANEASQVPYRRQMLLENETLAALREPFYNVSEPDLELRGGDIWELLVKQADANITRALWRRALRDRLRSYENQSVRMVVRRPEFVRRIFHLPSRLGAEGFALSLGWIVVQLFSLLTDSQAMRRFYNRGSPDKIKEAQRVICLRIVQENMGFAFNAEYVAEVATRDALDDVASIVQRVSRAFREQIGRAPALQDIQVPSYGNETGALFRYLESSREGHLRRAFRAFTDMPPLLLPSLETLTKGATTVEHSELSPWPYGVAMTPSAAKQTPLLSRVHREEQDFSLMPYALTFPVYEPGAPVSAKYGAVGSVAASSLAELFFANGSWSGPAGDMLREDIACFLTKPKNMSSLSRLDWELVFRLTSVEATFAAYREARENRTSDLSDDVPGMHGDRLFFFTWCYLQCGEYFGKDACNGPLRHSPAFAEVHGCPRGAPMRVNWRCGLFNNLD